jgi:ERCC4-type nuclease
MASNCIINSQYQNCSSVFSTSPKSNNMPRGTLINKEPIITTETSFNFNKILTPTALATFPPGSFEVILFIDNCEQSHAKRQDLLIDELKKANIVFDTGKLSVGDFAWIARQKNDSNYFNTALVLDFIVERKRMDDFCQSIIDGRYKEQKVILNYKD